MSFLSLFLTPRLGIKACVVINPLLGITWLFGLLFPVHKAFAYVFTILNSTQASVQWLLSKIIQSCTPFTPAKHVLLNWFSLNENYKQRTEKLDFPLDSSTD